MNELANKVLSDLLQKAANGIDAAVSFSQAQIPDVIHQLLVWNFVHSIILTALALASIPPVIWIVKKQICKVQVGVFEGEGCSWDRGKPKYATTLVWDSNGEISFAVIFMAAILIFWGVWVIVTLVDPTWLKIWLAPKLYLMEYATSLVK